MTDATPAALVIRDALLEAAGSAVLPPDVTAALERVAASAPDALLVDVGRLIVFVYDLTAIRCTTTTTPKGV